MTVTITTVAVYYKDHYPQPGERIKQYVVDERRERAWEEQTAPRFNVDPHDREGCQLHDDPECEYCKVLTHACPCAGESSLLELRDADCDVCNALYEKSLSEPRVIAWFAEKAKRPPICEDRTKLSDEVESEHPSLAMHPLLGRLKP